MPEDERTMQTAMLSDDLRVEEPVETGISIPADVLLATTTATAGNFVASFEMTPPDEETAVALARDQLAHLQAECDPSDDIVGGWRRVRGKRGSRVKLWEKGNASTLTLSDDGTDATGKNRRQRHPRKKSASLPVPLAVDHQRHRTTTSEVSRYATAAAPGTTSSGSSSVADGSADVLTHDTYAVRSSITVHASVASVMKTLDCSLATSYRSFAKIMYENLVADTSVLSHRRLSPSDDPEQPHLAESLAVRWLVCKCAHPLVSDCDLCLVEYSKVISIDELSAAGAAPNNQHADDNEEQDITDICTAAGANNGLRESEQLPIAYKIMRSTDTKHCPVLHDAPHHLERVHVPLGGFLLYATDNDDVTDVVFFMSATYDRKKASLHSAPFLSSDDRQFRAIQGVLHQMALGIGRIANAVDAYAMSLQLETLRSTRWIENADRSECVVCYRRFHPITRRRHHCRLCGEIMCRECSIHKDADLPTVGPTTLRICKLCNVQHFGRSSALAMVATDVKFQSSDQLLESSTLDSPATQQRSRRQTTLSIGISKAQTAAGPLTREYSHVSPKGLSSPRGCGGSTNARRHSVEPPVSCPKPRSQPGTDCDRASGVASVVSPGKWSKAFYANRAAAGARSPLSATSPLPLPRHSAVLPQQTRGTPLNSPQAKFARTMPLPSTSVSKATHQSQFSQSHLQRFSFGLMKKGGSAMPSPSSPLARPRQQSSGEAIADSPQGQWKTTPMQFTSTLPHKSALADPSNKPRRVSAAASSDNQDHDHGKSQQHRHRSSSQPGSITGTGQLSLTRRTQLDRVDQFEDLLCDLCERASDATGAKYASVSVFVTQSAHATTNGPERTDPLETMAHYLKVKGSPRLMKIAANMRCCAPVLHVLCPVVTRNALAFRLEQHGGYEFASLPFVKGPHQARFYAGTPLVDSKQRLVGAVAVFDAKIVDEQDELLVKSAGLIASIAQTTTARIEARQADSALRAFMNNPLLRQTEPILITRDGEDDERDSNEGGVRDEGMSPEDDDVDEERMRTFSRKTTVPVSSKSMQPLGAGSTVAAPSPAKKTDALEFYKRQMHRLVQQANQTQDQVMQNGMKMHQGVSY